MKIELKKLTTTAILPSKASGGAAGYDLHADIEDSIIILPEEVVLIPTGISIHIRNSNYMAMLIPRSGLGHKHGLVLGNLTGIIDSDYQKMVYVSLWNRNLKSSNKEYTVKPKERIAQMIFTPIMTAEWLEVKEFTCDTFRGGFGSTGR